MLTEVSLLSCSDSGHGKIILARILYVSFLGLVTAAATQYYRERLKAKRVEISIMPKLDRKGSGRVGSLERFSHYVGDYTFLRIFLSLFFFLEEKQKERVKFFDCGAARQLGFADPSQCPQLCKLAYDYLRKSKDCEDNIYEIFANETEAESLYVKLIEEFERCILSYFAFHWTQVSHLITQVIT